MMTLDEIKKLSPKFSFGGQAMVDNFIVKQGEGWCCIYSLLRHADGSIRSPYYFHCCLGGENAAERARVKFNEWWNNLNANKHGNN
jgi:hypothetical protein